MSDVENMNKATTQTKGEAMYSQADKIVLRDLEGEGELCSTERFACLYKNGDLLLALPEDREVAMATLALYQPQSFRARLIVELIRLLVGFKLHVKCLPSRKITFREQGPIAWLKADSGEFGFLLGNPSSDARCVIIARREGSELIIDKVGMSIAARESVKAEFSIMLGLPENLPGLLDLRQYDANEHWALYSCPMIEGKSPQNCHDGLVLEVLHNWASFSHKSPFSDSEHWRIAKDYADRYNFRKGSMLLDEWKDLRVMTGVMHGDFSPWNIKVTSDGKVVVVDWEYASPSGPGVWDWLHYLLQRATLVEKMSPSGTLKLCRSWASSAAGKMFMDETGWGKHTELCIGSYLLYTNAMGRFEHENLLAEWIRQ